MEGEEEVPNMEQFITKFVQLNSYTDHKYGNGR